VNLRVCSTVAMNVRVCSTVAMNVRVCSTVAMNVRVCSTVANLPRACVCRYQTQAQVDNAIANIPYMQGTTNTGQALKVWLF